MDNELYHHGVLGMKWGVRRYRNYDGTLTEAGKKQRQSSGSNVKSIRQTKRVLDDSVQAVDKLKKLNNTLGKSSSHKEQLDLSHMSNKELQDAINRYNLEKQYNNIFAKDVNDSSGKGREYVNNVLEIGGAALGIGSSALGIALSIKALKSGK